jgi:hypothetical protein
MSNLYRGPFIDASYQVSVDLAKLFQRRRYLEINQSETRITCGGHVSKRIGMDCSFSSNLLTTWPPQAILVSDWLISKKSSPLTPLIQMEGSL